MSDGESTGDGIASVRARLVERLQAGIGPALTAETAQAILERARASQPASARGLDRHFSECADALIAPSPHCPAVLVRLLRQLEADGFGAAVAQPACAVCGRTDRVLSRLTDRGRCCGWCVARTERRPCARCGQSGHIVRRTDEGPICRRCYRADKALFWQQCGGCGEHKPPVARRNGTALCQACAPRPTKECIRCGNDRPAHANTADGPVCQGCYTAPTRLCGRCGEVAPVRARATGDQPDLCVNCHWGKVGECTVCGRRRPGHHVSERDGAFHCRTCQPRPHRQCADCGRKRRVRANWPLGPVCDACYARRKPNPRSCSRCHAAAVMVGLANPAGGEDRAANGELCGPCCGTDVTFACNRCGFPGDIYADGACTRCVVGDRVRDLLSHDKVGTVAPELQPLAVGLIALDPPVTVLRWLQKGVGARILAQLVSERAAITHASLDALPQGLATRHVREMLVSTGILPRRQENLAGLELWLTSVVERLPTDQRRLIVPFAEWSVVRDARRRAARGRYTIRARTADRADISAAINFLTWLDTSQLKLAAIDQRDLDLWLTTHASMHRSIGSFIRWTTARHLTGPLTVPTRRTGLPARFLGEQEHHQQLKRCLNDGQLPLEARIAGALIGLYAVPVTRLVELTTDRFDRDSSGAYLTVDRNPVLLPPKLGHLIEEQISRAVSVSALRQPNADDPRFLFPGLPRTRPLSAGHLQTLMRQHDLAVIAARNTAMIEAVADLPPIVISDLFGISPTTAYAWARYAQDGWADYLAAGQDSE